MASDRPISLRLPADLITEIDRRTTKPDPHGKEADREREYGRADALRGALNRYYEVCRRHFARLDLSRGELGLVCEVLNGGMLGFDDGLGAARMSAIWVEIADIPNIYPSSKHPLGASYGAQWGLDDAAITALAQRLQSASYADLVALVDFVERFWADDPEAEKVIHPSKE